MARNPVAQRAAVSLLAPNAAAVFAVHARRSCCRRCRPDLQTRRSGSDFRVAIASVIAEWHVRWRHYCLVCGLRYLARACAQNAANRVTRTDAACLNLPPLPGTCLQACSSVVRWSVSQGGVTSEEWRQGSSTDRLCWLLISYRYYRPSAGTGCPYLCRPDNL
jgi:hypothetical protein